MFCFIFRISSSLSVTFDAARNKSIMIEWLKQTLDIDYQALSINSFVHMQHELCVEIYALLCQRSRVRKGMRGGLAGGSSVVGAPSTAQTCLRGIPCGMVSRRT